MCLFSFGKLFCDFKHYDVDVSFPAIVLKGTPYQNNSIVTLENIGEGDAALLCITNLTACCRRPYTSEMGPPTLGNWFFPNGTRVPSTGSQWDFHRTRGQMKVLLQRRRGGEEGIYRCEISDAMNVTQTIYIGVYSASGTCTLLFCSTTLILQCLSSRIVRVSQLLVSSTVLESHSSAI